MPTTYTHDLFGKRVCRKLPEKLQHLIRSNGNLYRIGQHGPDILFYYFISKNPVTQYGVKMHGEKAREFFEKGMARVRKEKNPALMRLKFDISGSVSVSCDRCGNPLKINLWDEFNIIVKMVENPDEMNEQEEDPDIYYIGLQESHLHLSGWIYEFINLSIPYQKECAEDEVGGPQCNKEVLEKLRKMREETEKGSNSIWKGLENLNLKDEDQEQNETKK